MRKSALYAGMDRREENQFGEFSKDDRYFATSKWINKKLYILSIDSVAKVYIYATLEFIIIPKYG